MTTGGGGSQRPGRQLSSSGATKNGTFHSAVLAPAGGTAAHRHPSSPIAATIPVRERTTARRYPLGASRGGLGLGGEAMRVRLVSGADPGRYAGALVVVAGVYYLVGRIGLELAYLNGAVAALWPPAGFGLAVLFLYGIRLWPAVVVGDLLLGDFSTPLARCSRRRSGTRSPSWSPRCCCGA